MKVLRSTKGELPVVCVGSVFVGGAGKTPFVRLLLEHLPQNTWVLTRGYKEIDEPLFYPNCVIEKDRLKGVKKCKEAGAQLVVMDDGLQHLALEKQLKIAMVTKEQLTQEWEFLPLGALRDSPKTLQEVDYVVIHEVASLEDYENCKKQIEATGSKARCIGSQTVFAGFSRPLEKKRAILLSSIARPHRFLKLMLEQGVEVLEHIALADHTKLSLEDFHRYIEKAERLDAILVLTEKDAVKYPLDKKSIQAKIVTQIVYDQENFDHLTGKIHETLG